MRFLSARITKGLLLAAPFLLAQNAMAHPDHGTVQGFVSGLVHPLSGLDHILAMVAVGILAAQMGNRALWMLPLVFPLMMIAGGSAGMAQWPVAGVEAGIAVSSLVLGGLVFWQAQLRTALAVMLVATLALFHGYAHGAEMPAGVNGLLFGLGFVLGTLVLHSAGLTLGYAHRWSAGQTALRGVGAAIAATGAAFLLRALA